MTPDDFTEWRESLGLNRVQAAKALGMSRNTVAAYENGQPIPLYVELACRFLESDANNDHQPETEFAKIVKDVLTGVAKPIRPELAGSISPTVSQLVMSCDVEPPFKIGQEVEREGFLCVVSDITVGSYPYEWSDNLCRTITFTPLRPIGE